MGRSAIRKRRCGSVRPVPPGVPWGPLCAAPVMGVAGGLRQAVSDAAGRLYSFLRCLQSAAVCEAPPRVICQHNTHRKGNRMSLVVRPNSSAAGPVAGGSAKWLWAAIGALGVSVLALGATLVVQNRDRAPDVASAVQPAAALAPDAQSAAAANPSINPAAVQGVQGRPSAVAQAPAQQFAQRAPSPAMRRNLRIAVPRKASNRLRCSVPRHRPA